MKIDLNVDVHHLTRIEGHGNIRISVRKGRIEEARWDVVETPRYFEVMLRGKHYTTAAVLTSRICGICSIGHCLASLRATESAFGVTVPEAAVKLRLLAKHGETLQSHALHLLFLVAPDFLKVPSVIPLIESNPELVKLAARLKGTANAMCDVVAGRTTHPISLQVGGVSRMPEKPELLSLRDGLKRALDDLVVAAEVFAAFPIPDFARDTEFVSLGGRQEYPWIGGRLVSSDGVDRGEEEYLSVTNEFVDEANTSKWCRLSRDSYAVGALARFNNNSGFLHGDAVAFADKLRLKPGCCNPFMNNVAQLVECFHVVNDSIEIVNDLVKGGREETMVRVRARDGQGVGAVEVPRGILFHHYRYDGDGRIVSADCVIPTTQNNLNIHLDLKALVEQFAVSGMTDGRLERLASMLVRAYDPCVSCSVH